MQTTFGMIASAAALFGAASSGELDAVTGGAELGAALSGELDAAADTVDLGAEEEVDAAEDFPPSVSDAQPVTPTRSSPPTSAAPHTRVRVRDGAPSGAPSRGCPVLPTGGSC